MIGPMGALPSVSRYLTLAQAMPTLPGPSNLGIVNTWMVITSALYLGVFSCLRTSRRFWRVDWTSVRSCHWRCRDSCEKVISLVELVSLHLRDGIVRALSGSFSSPTPSFDQLSSVSLICLYFLSSLNVPGTESVHFEQKSFGKGRWADLNSASVNTCIRNYTFPNPGRRGPHFLKCADPCRGFLSVLFSYSETKDVLALIICLLCNTTSTPNRPSRSLVSWLRWLCPLCLGIRYCVNLSREQGCARVWATMCPTS